MMLKDIQYAYRTLARMPWYTAVIIVSMAIGIGVNTTVFSWIQAVILEPLPGVAHASQYHLIEPRAPTGSYPGVSWLEYQDIAERVPSLQDPIAYRMAPFNVGEAPHTARTYGMFVSANYFTALGLQPALGRFFRPDEAAGPDRGRQQAVATVAVISHPYWQTRFAGSANVVGQTIRVNDAPLTIVGVAPERFQGTVLSLQFDLWVPATLAPTLIPGSRELVDRTQRGYSILSRLREVPRRQAQSEFERALQELARAYPAANGAVGGEVLPFWQAPRGPQRLLAEALVLLQAVLLLLLLAVCANTANLVLARASTRQREIGVRLALGAGRSRIVTLLLVESLVLAAPGAALGAAFAVWGTTALRAVPFIGAFPIRFQTGIDLTALLFTTALGAACGLLFGLAPALQLARVDPQAALRAGARTAAKSRMRNFLIGSEVGVALVVLMAAGLFWRGFAETRETDPGFRREGVLLAAYDLSGRNADAASSRTFAIRLLERLRALPALESAAIAAAVPLDIHGLPLRSFAIEGRPKNDREPDTTLVNTVTPGYFQTMGIPVREGRDFAGLDDPSAPPQAIVNEEFVRRFVEGAAIGRRLEMRGTTHVIAGVVRNSLSESFDERPTPVVYLSYRDRPSRAGEIHVRTRAGSEQLLAPAIERAVRGLDPSLPVYDIRTLSEHVEKNLFLRRIPARMFVVLGPMLLLLAAIGVYASVDFAVSRRTAEIGVRLALGASAPRVAGEIVREGVEVIAYGLMAGWLVVFMAALHLLHGVLDLRVFAGVPLALLAVATFATWLPARRAAALNPLAALRQE